MTPRVNQRRQRMNEIPAVPRYHRQNGACHHAAFSGTLPSMEAEIDCRLQSNSS
jgi:hypothetical protein